LATLQIIDETSAPKRLTAGANASRRKQAEYEGYLKTVKKGRLAS
jgi:hypothetical protein